MNLVIGVTGGIGSGKTAATNHFEDLGITVVDADLAARVIMEPDGSALAAVAERYGPDILLADGQLDRSALRARIFSDASERTWLEQLTHPLIGDEIMAQMEASQSAYTILSSPLLLETTQKGLCSEVLLIDVPEEVQLTRTMSRDDNDEAQVRRIMAAQMPRNEKRALADHIIDNSLDQAALHRAVDEFHATIIKRQDTN
jgi:dephospho-CoA kinase